MGSVVVAFRPHWINGWFLRLFTQPFVALDGDVHPCSWRRATTIETPAGTHELQSFVRYQRTSLDEGSRGGCTITVPTDQPVAVTCSNGWANHIPFIPRVTA